MSDECSYVQNRNLAIWSSESSHPNGDGIGGCLGEVDYEGYIGGCLGEVDYEGFILLGLCQCSVHKVTIAKF